MRRIFFCTLLFIVSFHFVQGQTTIQKDSLRKSLDATTDVYKRVKTYRNLADIYFEEPEEKVYLEGVYDEAKKIKDTKSMMEALSDLASLYLKLGRQDSVFHYMHLLEKADKPDVTVRYLSYIRARLFEVNMREGNGDLVVEDSLLNHIKVDKNNMYIVWERAYVTGSGLYAQDKMREALPYLQAALDQAAQFPDTDKYRFQTLTNWLLAGAYSFIEQHQKSIAIVENSISMHQNYYKYVEKERPFYNINTRYIQCYAFIVSRADYIPKEKADYYRTQMARLMSLTDNPYDKYHGFLAMNNDYLSKNDWVNAARTNDSLIRYAYMMAPYNLPGLHDIQAQIYEQMGDYKQAFEHEKRYALMKDSITSLKSEEKLNKLQVEYDFDKLNFENARLENKNKLILLLTLSFILVLVCAVCIHLYYNLKKEKRTKEEMRRLMEKAEESENMKTVFVNSICHEIRTPLNSIVGFSEVLADNSIEEECKEELAELITGNAAVLTTLVDDMLYVANLDSSAEPLKCAEVDLCSICHQEMDRARSMVKSGIDCKLELPDESFLISTDAEYLALVLKNLLDNACKFTDEGSITMGYYVDVALQKLVIYVADTGCGIPSDKYDEVFERFTKLDAFKRGTGLGLYLCRLIVTRLYGEIAIDSTYARGTRIQIFLPLK